jgi:hypothetical protein
MKTIRTAAMLGLVLTMVGGNRIASAQLLVDSDFNGSTNSAVLRANSAGQDWYESRQDGLTGPTLLTLDTTPVGGNATPKAKLTGRSAANAYLTQEFSSPQTQRFSAQWDIYVDSILDISGHPDCAAWMLIGDDTGTDRTRIGPNAEDSERFVYMAFYKNGGGTSGTMDLVAAEPGPGNVTYTPIATNLSLKQWYTIRVDVDLTNDTYDVYVDNNKVAAAWPARTPKTSLTYISFAQWNNGAGTFYVDNVTAESSSAGQAGEIVVMDETWRGGGITACENYIPDLGQWAHSWAVSSAPAGARVTGVSYLVSVASSSDVGPNFRCSDYEIGFSSTARGGTAHYFLVWDNAGGAKDQDMDDDAPNDYDIELSRTTDAFNGQAVNQTWYFRLSDTVSGVELKGTGCFSRLKLVIRYGEALSCPSVTTQAATAVQLASATLNGRITDDRSQACQYRFRYKNEGGSYIETAWSGSVRNGAAFSQTISGLSQGTKYFFAAQARNGSCDGTWGSELSFTTLAVKKPTVATLPATNVQDIRATLVGKIITDGNDACAYRFRYLLPRTVSRGPTIPIPPRSPGEKDPDNASPTALSMASSASGLPIQYTYTTPWTGVKRTGESFSQDTLSEDPNMRYLDPNTLYSVAAQARNSAGESGWGNEVEFRTTLTDNDKDDISDQLEKQLLNRFRPCFLFSQNGDSKPEDYRPADVRWYIARSELLASGDEDSSPVIDNDHLVQNPETILALMYSSGPPWNPVPLYSLTNILENTVKTKYYINPLEKWQGNNGNPGRHGESWDVILQKKNVGLYGHVVRADTYYQRGLIQGRDPAAYKYMKIEYWQLFGYNDTGQDFDIADHEGDWATVQLLYDPDLDPAIHSATLPPGTNPIVSIYHYAHGHEMRFDMSGAEIAALPDFTFLPGWENFTNTYRIYLGGNAGKSFDEAGPDAICNTLILRIDPQTQEFSHPVVYIEHGTHEFWPTSQGVFTGHGDVAGIEFEGQAPPHRGDDFDHSYLTENVPNLGEVGHPLAEVEGADIVLHYNGYYGAFSHKNHSPPGPVLHTEWTYPANDPIREAIEVIRLTTDSKILEN